MLGRESDTFSMHLKGTRATELSEPHNILTDHGSGKNTLTVSGGTVKGSLYITAGKGTDSVTLGGTSAAKALTVNGNANINLDGAGDDSLTLNRTTVQGNLTATFANTILLDAQSTVGKNANLLGGNAGNDVTLNGTVKGDVTYAAAPSDSAGSTLTVGGTISGNLTFKGNSQADALTVASAASIGGNLTAELGSGDDTATIGGTVSGNLVLDGGGGNDAMTIRGSVTGRTA